MPAPLITRRTTLKSLAGGTALLAAPGRPRTLLMDEPCAALDEITRMKLNNDVIRLAAENRLTVIFVTHSLFESVYMSNRIIVQAARPGRVAADLAVSAPWPRDESFRTTAGCAEECRRMSVAWKTTLSESDIDHQIITLCLKPVHH